MRHLLVVETPELQDAGGNQVAHAEILLLQVALKNGLQFTFVLNSRDPDGTEAVAQGWRQLLLAIVTPRIHGGHNTEVRVCDNDICRRSTLLRQGQRAAGFENTAA